MYFFLLFYVYLKFQITVLPQTFFSEEVTHKLKIHQDEMIEKQNQIQFTVTKKMDESIQNDVTKIVKVIM